jgi:hypothetical protein
MSSKIKQVVPAVGGTMVVWYNHRLHQTRTEPVLFWGLCVEDGEQYVVPLTINPDGGFCTELWIPDGYHPEGHEREGDSSDIIAYDIPSWGRITVADGEHIYAVSGWKPDLSWQKQMEAAQ